MEWYEELTYSSSYSAAWSTLAVADDANIEQLLEAWFAKWSGEAELDKSVPERRAYFAAQHAESIAQTVRPSLGLFHPGPKLSARMCFFADDESLVVVVGPQESQTDADMDLAYGLAWACDRDLTLVLHEYRALPALQRQPWIEPKVTVFTYSYPTPSGEMPFALEPAIVPARTEVLQQLASDPLETTVHDLAERVSWVGELVNWIKQHPQIEDASRGSYLGWHCEGRLVLRLARTTAGVHVAAGVNYSKPTDEQVPAVPLDLSGPLSPEQVASIQAAVELAITKRLNGIDDTHVEHRLQAHLGREPDVLGLFPNPLREFPVYRPGNVRAYVDLLGVDADGDLHIVETKLAKHGMLMMGLHGLDYWVWVTAHVNKIAALLELPKTPKVRLDFVMAEPAEDGTFIDRYTASIVEALAGVIPWRFQLVHEWKHQTPNVEKLPLRVDTSCSTNERALVRGAVRWEPKKVAATTSTPIPRARCEGPARGPGGWRWAYL